MKKIKVKSLKNDSFKKYGQLISDSKNCPDVENDLIKYWDSVFELDLTEGLNTGIVEGKSNDREVDGVEKHTDSPEIIAALSDDFIILLGKGEAESKIEYDAFLVKHGTAIVLDENTWHSVPLAVNESCRCLIVFKKDTFANDLVLNDLSEKIKIII
jgi:ureidoglycolate hydrolase